MESVKVIRKMKLIDVLNASKIGGDSRPIYNILSLPMSAGGPPPPPQIASDRTIFQSATHLPLAEKEFLHKRRQFGLLALANAFTDFHVDADGNNTQGYVVNDDGMKIWIFAKPKPSVDPDIVFRSDFLVELIDEKDYDFEAVALGFGDKLYVILTPGKWVLTLAACNFPISLTRSLRLGMP